MTRRLFYAALVLGLALPFASPRVAAQAPTPAAPVVPVALSAADGAVLMGEWTITAEGMQGPTTMTLTLKADGDKTVGEISSAVMPTTAITDITKRGEVVVLRYGFDYEGNWVPTVVTLTPNGDTLGAVFDFADGAYTMMGTAARKKS